MFIRMCLQQNDEVVRPFDGIISIQDKLLDNAYVVVKDKEKFYGVLTPQDIVKRKHQLVVDCLVDKPKLNEYDDTEKALSIMNEEKQYVLPVFSKGNSYIGCTTYQKIMEEIGLLKKEPVNITVENIIGEYEIESVKQAFIHELYHITKNPIQVIYSSLTLYTSSNSQDENNILIDAILKSTKQIDDSITNLFFNYFKID
jgi:predicted transcriptional regulator